MLKGSSWLLLLSVLALAACGDGPAVVHLADNSAARLQVESGQNELHRALQNQREDAFAQLLSNLTCEQLDALLQKRDLKNNTPLMLAAQGEDVSRSTWLFIEMLSAKPNCENLVDNQLALAAQNPEHKALSQLVFVLAHSAKGIARLAAFLNHASDESLREQIAATFKQLYRTTSNHILARAYYQSLENKDTQNSKDIFKLVCVLNEEDQKLVIGFMLYLDAGQSEKALRDQIVSEAKKLRLDDSIFRSSENEIAELKAKLDEVVVGQEAAKISLSVAIKNHYKRLKKGQKKSNVLIVGPSGTGKTYIVQTIADAMGVPFVLADASNITQAGYRDGKIKEAIVDLARKANYEQKQIDKGIIFLDEIDKMAARGGRAESEEFKRQAQATLLKVLEGVEVDVGHDGNSIKVDTSKILFVCAGAFTGLTDIVQNRLNQSGLGADENIYNNARAEDLIAYGLTPELVGRLPNLVALHELREQDLAQILMNPKASVLTDYVTLWKSNYDVDLKFTPAAIKAIAKRAAQLKTGARGLRTVVEPIMAKIQFGLGNMGVVKTLTVTDRVILFQDMPDIQYGSAPSSNANALVVQ